MHTTLVTQTVFVINPYPTVRSEMSVRLPSKNEADVTSRARHVCVVELQREEHDTLVAQDPMARKVMPIFLVF